MQGCLQLVLPLPMFAKPFSPSAALYLSAAQVGETLRAPLRELPKVEIVSIMQLGGTVLTWKTSKGKAHLKVLLCNLAGCACTHPCRSDKNKAR